MAVLSGKDGTLLVDGQLVAQVTNWRLIRRSVNKAYTANDTGGWRRRVRGANDCAGHFELLIAESGSVPVAAGQPVTLRLHLDASGSNYCDVPARIETVRLPVDISEGKIVPYVVTFSGNGPVVCNGVLKSREIIYVQH